MHFCVSLRPLAIFSIFEGKNSPNGFVGVIRKQIG
jgi:hypothetical protein